MLSECSSGASDRSSGRRRPSATLRLCFMSRVFCAAVIYCGMNDCETVYERVYEETQSANTQRWRRDDSVNACARAPSASSLWRKSLRLSLSWSTRAMLKYTGSHEFTLTYNQSKGYAYLSCCLRGGLRPIRANLMSSRRRNWWLTSGNKSVRTSRSVGHRSTIKLDLQTNRAKILMKCFIVLSLDSPKIHPVSHHLV